MSWKTIDQMRDAGVSLGGGITELLQRRAAQKAAAIKQASEDAFKRQSAPELDLPTEAPETPAKWQNILMNRSRNQAEASGKQFAADRLTSAPATPQGPRGWQDYVIPANPAKARLESEAATARGRADLADQALSTPEFATDKANYEKNQKGWQDYLGLQKPEVEDLLRQKREAAAAGGRGPGGSGNPFANYKEGRQWLNDASKKLFIIVGTLPEAKTMYDKHGNFLVKNIDPLTQATYNAYKEGLEQYRKIMNRTPEQMPIFTLEQFVGRTPAQRKQYLASMMAMQPASSTPEE